MVAMKDQSGAAIAVGRFAGWEPLGFEAGDNNWYRFVANGPTRNIDPSGMIAPVVIYGGLAASAWIAICGWVSVDIAEDTFADDKQKHCMAACVFNRCTLLIVPGITLAGAVAWEVVGGWVAPDSREDIVAGAWGIVRSYGVVSSCKDACTECRDVTGLQS